MDRKKRFGLPEGADQARVSQQGNALLSGNVGGQKCAIGIPRRTLFDDTESGRVDPCRMEAFEEIEIPFPPVMGSRLP